MPTSGVITMHEDPSYQRVTHSDGRGRITTISTSELHRHLSDPEQTIVDVRPLPAFNGWRLAGEVRGGHIPGAVAFLSTRLTMVDDAAVVRLLRAKNVVASREIVLYGYGFGDVVPVQRKLTELGHTAVGVYEDGWSTWAADPGLPVDRLPNYERLVYPDWVRQLLAGDRPEAAPSTTPLLFHVNFGVPQEYQESHLPEAHYLDTNLLESSTDWNRRAPEQLEDAVRRLGIAHDTPVILYGRDTEGEANEKWPGRRAGQIAATWAAMLLHYCMRGSATSGSSTAGTTRGCGPDITSRPCGANRRRSRRSVYASRSAPK